MRIAVDLDGVLADTMVSVCQILNLRGNGPVTVESFDRWRAWEIAGITKDEFFRALDEAWFSWETLPPTEEALDAKVGKLEKFGTVDIVTGRSPETVSQANSWLEHHRIPFDAFVRTGNSTTAKLSLLYDVYIDDSAELMALLASRLHGSGILYLRPWNRDAIEMPRISKVDQWDQIPDAIEQFAATNVT
jgi:5'(3')-deoxyribonucleotidase